MSDIKIVLNDAGIQDLLKSPGIISSCEAVASGMLNRAGTGYAMERKTYPERGGYIVYPDNADAFYDNLRGNTLLKAVR